MLRFLIYRLDWLLCIFEEIVNKLIVVNNFNFVVLFGLVYFLEQFIHVLRIEFKIALYFLHPSLIHFIEIGLHNLSNFKIDETYIFVGVNFNDVGNEEECKLYLLGIWFFVDFGSEICNFFIVIV